MSSYVVVGASRGLGFEFLRQLSENPSNIVVGLVRNVQASKEKVDKEINRSNVHILYADLNNYETFSPAADETSNLTGGKLDYLIANAAIGWDNYTETLSQMGTDPARLEKELTKNFRTNAVGSAQVINAFMPLVLKGTTKKVIALTSGMGDIDLTRNYDLWMGAPYSISKAALNMIIAKFSAEYREKGVLFLGISPGVVDTQDELPEPVMQVAAALGAKIAAYEPKWKGAITPEESVKLVLSVIKKASIENGNAGDFLSHLGNRQWV